MALKYIVSYGVFCFIVTSPCSFRTLFRFLCSSLLVCCSLLKCFVEIFRTLYATYSLSVAIGSVQLDKLLKGETFSLLWNGQKKNGHFFYIRSAQEITLILFFTSWFRIEFPKKVVYASSSLVLISDVTQITFFISIKVFAENGDSSWNSINYYTIFFYKIRHIKIAKSVSLSSSCEPGFEKL